MASFSNPSDTYFDDPTRSPRSMRQSNMPRQTLRPFEGYGTAPSTRFGADNGAANLRYDSMREAFNAPPINNANFPYDVGAAQNWNSAAATIPTFGGVNAMEPFGSTRGMKQEGLRADSYYTPMPVSNPPPLPSFGSGTRLASIIPRRDLSADGGDDELIPTAIVIKNIPFAVKKEQLQDLMTKMTLPLPYAFNYHFDNGVFRGLAFANFTSAEETAMVIRALNHFEINGRKLRVEYKKMLPLYERERIEREKRERRGQLEEQHRPMAPNQLQNQLSFSSLTPQIPRNTPSPSTSQGPAKPEIDMNDPKNMEFYSQILLYKSDPTREVLIFPPSLTPSERRAVHVLAHRLGLHHSSRGVGDQRQVHILRQAPGSGNSPPSASMPDAFQGKDGYHRPLTKATTTDFHELTGKLDRQLDAPHYNTLRGQSSVGLLEVNSNANENGFRHDANLRSAKSFHELRHRVPSPVSSTASFPTGWQTNGTRLQAFNDTEGTNTPILTPTASSSGQGLPNDDGFLINGMNSMNLSANTNKQASPRRGRLPFSNWDEPQNYAPIGSNRTVSVNADNTSQERMQVRQPRGPGAERATGFRRQNTRGSDELRNAQSIIAE